MRVMTWNLWWRFDGRHQTTVGEPATSVADITGQPPPAGDWRRRQHRIISTLDAVRPDIIGLQEVWATADGTQAQILAQHLGMHSAFGAPSLPPPPRPPMSSDHEGVDLGVAVLSRWPIADVRQHRLPARHDAGAVALAVIVDHPDGPLHAVVSCVDWELDLAALRLAQTRTLAALLTDPSRDGPLPVLLMADLNAPPSTPEIRALTDVMVDAWIAGGGAADAGHTLRSDNPLAPREAWQIDHRIDYIMARPGTPERPVTVERAFVAGDPHDGLPPSDHSAVVADFGL